MKIMHKNWIYNIFLIFIILFSILAVFNNFNSLNFNNLLVDKDDKILSVVTCSRFFMDNINYDFIVSGRLVKEDEKIGSYKVSRNKNYVEIDEILKGVDDDESKENA